MSNNNQALQAVNTQAVVGSFTQKELDTLKSTIANGTTDEQFALFVQTCVASGLNPFLNQIFCTVYKGQQGPQMSIQIAVEGIVMLAKRNPAYKGFIAAEVRANDEFSADYTKGEVIHTVKGLVDRGATVGAYCVAYREGTPNILVIITTDQVEHLKKSDKGAQARMWKDYFDDMIVKYAIKRAFKRQFGVEVAEDEYIPSENSIETTGAYQRRDITAEANQMAAAQPDESAPPPADAKLAEARQKMATKFQQLGITDPKEMGAYISKNAKPKGDKPTLAEILGLLKLMDADIEKKKAQDAAGDDLDAELADMIN